MSTEIPTFRDKFARGWPEHAEGERAVYLDLARAMTEPHASDAHFATYAVPAVERRLATEHVFAEIEAVPIVLFVVDVEPDGHAPVTPEWWTAERAKLERLRADHAGGYVYRTRGGYRIVYQLAAAYEIRSTADATRWKATYLAWLDHLQERYAIVGDRACQDWTRLYRLPRVVRDGQRQDLETIGDAAAIGTWAVEVTIAEPEPTTPRKSNGTYRPRSGEFSIHDFMSAHYPGVQSRAVLGGERWDIECPWAHEHSSKSRRDTSVFAYSSGAHEFKCLHNHCADRHWKEFRRFHEPDWVPFDERPFATPGPRTHNDRDVPPSNVPRLPADLTLVGPPAQEAQDARPPRYGHSYTQFVGEEPDDDPAEVFDVHGLIVRGEPGLVIGYPKVGKTFLLEDLLMHVAAGRKEWCGVPIYRRVRVLLFLREDSERTSRRRLHQLARGAGIEQWELDEWLDLEATEPLYFDDVKLVAKLEAQLADYDICAIDSLSTIHNADENSVERMAPIMNRWRDLALRTSTAIPLVHHFRKRGEERGNSSSSGGSILTRARGSSIIGATTRHAVGVDHGPGDHQVVISVESNHEIDLEPFVIQRQFSTDERGRKLITHTRIGSLHDARDAQEQGLLNPLVLDVIRAAAAGGVGVKELREAVNERIIARQGRGIRGTRIDAEAKRLMRAGLVEQIKVARALKWRVVP